MKDVLTPASAGRLDRHLAPALAGGGKDGVSDCRHDADFQFDLQIEPMNLVRSSEAI
jgi:hypothetical protein